MSAGRREIAQRSGSAGVPLECRPRILGRLIGTSFEKGLKIVLGDAPLLADLVAPEVILPQPLRDGALVHLEAFRDVTRRKQDFPHHDSALSALLDIFRLFSAQ